MIINLAYNISIWLYTLAIRLAAPFFPKAKLWIEGRKNIFTHIETKLKQNEQRIWFHCASLGEFEQGRPIIEKMKEKYKDVKIVLSFYSPSGYEIRKNYELADYVFYLPSDTPGNARKFVSLINPLFAVFVKYEFWYHYIESLHKKNIPLYFASSVFRPTQHFFSWYGGFFRKMLGKTKHIFVQDDASLSLLKTIGIENASVAGDTRFDRVIEIASKPLSMTNVDRFVMGFPVFIAGSTWSEDEKIIRELYRSNSVQNCKFIIAPHEISQTHIDTLLSDFSPFAIRYSELSDLNAVEARVLIIDNVGLLSSLYRFGNMAYIGGGFGKGIHNILEAAVYKIPVVFGPNYKKFREASDLLGLSCAYCVHNQYDLIQVVAEIHQNNLLLEQIRLKVSSYFEKESGASHKIVNMIKL